MMASRFIFSTAPSDAVRLEAETQGQAFLTQVRDFLDGDGGGGAGAGLGPLTRAVLQALPADATAEERAITVAGAMLGFPPTVHGNFVRIIDRWQTSSQLWSLQQQLLPQLQAHANDAVALHGAIGQAMADAVVDAMREGPIPETIWRTPAHGGVTVAGKAPKRPDDPIVLGLASAVKDRAAPPELMFGGTFGNAFHACPGYAMAVGVLSGMLAALLAAGQWRTTGSSMQLLLVKPGR